MIRTQKPLSQLFTAMFHGKQSFDAFLHASLSEEVKKLQVHTGRKDRTVLVPSAKLRAFHHFLRIFLVDFLPIAESATFAYRKGFSARDAVAGHVDSLNFYTGDIQNFFPSISQGRVRTAILGARSQLPISDLDDHLERILQLVCFEGVLPVGFSTSPGISNSVLLPLDEEMLRRCAPLDLIYTRYADDIILSAPSRNAIAGAEELLVGALADTFGTELALHPDKSKHFHAGKKVKLLGMVLLPGGHITVDAAVKAQVETMLHYYLRRRGEFQTLGENPTNNNEARLAGLLNYVNTVDKGYLDKLRKKYGSAVVDLFLHRSFG